MSASCAHLRTPSKRQRHRAAEIRRRIPRHLVDGEVIVRDAFQEAAHGDFGDEPRHLRAQTEMLAGAEAEMPKRPTLDVERVRIRKFALVAVGRAEGECNLVTGANCLTVQRDVEWRCA